MITVLANRNGLSCIQAKMIKVAASKTLAEILGELIDPRGEAHSTTVYGYKTNMAEQDRVELMLDLSVAEVLQCDDTIRKIRFDMCTLAAPQVVQHAGTPAHACCSADTAWRAMSPCEAPSHSPPWRHVLATFLVAYTSYLSMHIIAVTLRIWPLRRVRS